MPKKSDSKKTKASTKKGPVYNKDGNELWNVEKILGRRFMNGKAHYLVKWDGYPSSANSWEPIENVETVSQMIEDFEAKYCPDSNTEINLQEASSPITKKISKQPKHSHKEKKEKKHSKKKDRLEKLLRQENPKSAQMEGSRGIKIEPKPQEPSEEEFDDEEVEEEEIISRGNGNNGDINFDIPLIITEHSCFGKKDSTPQNLSDLVYKVEFKTENGRKKHPTFYTFNVLKAKCPELLLDYLQKSVKF